MSELVKFLEKAKKEGLKNGQSGNPPPHAENPCAVEVGYAITAQKLFADEKNKFLKAKVEVSKKIEDIETEIETIESDINSMGDIENLPDLVKAKLDEDSARHKEIMKDYLLKESTLKAFKVNNGLQRSANYPEDFHSHFSWIFLILAIESVANAYFFSANTGLAQGALIALVFSFINVSIGVATGLFFRYKNHKDGLSVAFGWGALILGICLLIGLNSITATARSLTELAKVGNEAVLTANLWKSAITEGLRIFTFELPFQDQNGFMLFFVGIISGGIAIWKGYTALDEYPGYTSVDRLAKTARKNKEEIEKSCSILANSVSKSQRDLREGIIRRFQTFGKNLNRISAEFKQRCVHLNSKKTEIQSDYKQIIVGYRSAVKAVTPVGIPEYFHDEPDAGLEIDQSLIDEINDQISYINGKVESIQSELFPRLQQQISDIDNMKSAVVEAINSFFAASSETARHELGSQIQTLEIGKKA